MQFFLDFEKPLVELRKKINELRDYSTDSVDFSGELKKLVNWALSAEGPSARSQ